MNSDITKLLDIGLKETKLKRVINDCGISQLLDFSFDDAVTARIKKLTHLLSVFEWKSITKSEAIVSYVYNSNKIEGENLSLDRTRKIVDNSEQFDDDNPTVTLFNLVSELGQSSLYDPITNKFAVGNVEDWKKWHSQLMKYAPDIFPGEFRTCGVYASEYVFPHHSVVESNMQKLAEVLHHFSYTITKEPCLRKVFALASFAQYHFVNIHPFSDGNGRMCRLLSKLILDTFIPFPIPQFSKRDEYIKSVSSDDPLKLCILMLDEAIVMYENTEKKMLNYDVGSEKELYEICSIDKLSLRDTEIVVNTWKAISWTKPIEIILDERRIILSKPMSETDFANL